MCPKLEISIRLVIDNFSLFKRPWAFLRRNLSGKYRLGRLTETNAFDELKSTRDITVGEDGVYLQLDQKVRVDLMVSNTDLTDFYFPNGGFSEKGFELISYSTNDRREESSTPYIAPATGLPPSETEGLGSLDVQENCFGNLPPVHKDYIKRIDLEDELQAVMLNERHPVITLQGRGGIGKTWLALSVLHQLTMLDRYFAICWFSARDIDLLPDGPKLVKPKVLSVGDIAMEFLRLMNPADVPRKVQAATSYLGNALTRSPVEGPLLYVFDNFETTQDPGDLFAWIDTYIRLPNKVLITTRSRKFKGDYPVKVPGMNDSECGELINHTARRLGIIDLLTESYRDKLISESEGHPYVIKVLLGEVAKAQQLIAVPRILAAKDDILQALFERTFVALSPAAKRVFYTLCNWRSTIPQVALEAVLLRAVQERIDVEEAVTELNQSSLIEVAVSEQDNNVFLSVPLVASEFGKRKLAVDPLKSAVEADTILLYSLGAGKPCDIRYGIAPRIDRMVRSIADVVSKDNNKLDEYIEILEYIARQDTAVNYWVGTGTGGAD